MKKTRFLVTFETGQEVHILTFGVYNAAVLAMAHEICNGRSSVIQSITNLDANEVYLQTEDMDFELT